ncbi:MAG: protein-L-isoaspartate(D-aspartate) O-methyltransferase [Candidatus Omnitrophica bacterium]|nr:protein-L-isoaspartate(D-aspartate) O-methyltransferase [Candidatus Omnitrophota bacterium]
MAYETERNEMVAQQLMSRGIGDKRVLETFRDLPRHEFISGQTSSGAYADHPLSIGEGQTISQPYMVALMTECLRLEGNEKVLEIGTGSGYQAAVLGCLAAEVYSVERFQSLADKAQQVLDKIGFKNIKIKVGDGTLGWQEFAPYDAIVVTAGAPHTPVSLIKQLKNNGRLAIPVGGSLNQVLTVIEKKGKKLLPTEICGCVFVPLVGEEGWQKD